jgi:hypothetical protein
MTWESCEKPSGVRRQRPATQEPLHHTWGPWPGSEEQLREQPRRRQRRVGVPPCPHQASCPQLSSISRRRGAWQGVVSVQPGSPRRVVSADPETRTSGPGFRTGQGTSLTEGHVFYPRPYVFRPSCVHTHVTLVCVWGSLHALSPPGRTGELAPQKRGEVEAGGGCWSALACYSRCGRVTWGGTRQRLRFGAQS